MATLVSAFYDGVNSAGSVEGYMALGQQLVDLPVNKVIFLAPHHVKRLTPNEHTILVPYELSFPTLLDSAELALPRQRNVSKDTARYLWLMNHKTDFVRRAVLRNAFGASQFAWIDFGIAKLWGTDREGFARDMQALATRTHRGAVRIASIWSLHHAPPTGDGVQWYFAGGVFGGDAQSLLSFAALQQRELQDALFDNSLSWEVNLWYRIWRRRPGLFSTYVADHNPSIVRAY